MTTAQKVKKASEMIKKEFPGATLIIVLAEYDEISNRTNVQWTSNTNAQTVTKILDGISATRGMSKN